MNILRSLAKAVLLRGGYELHKLPPPGFFRLHEDAWADQQRLLKGRDVRCIFDVGANEGQTVARLQSAFPEAEIHAFEPGDDAFAHLTRRFGGAPRVCPWKLAVGERTGGGKLYLNRFNQTNSLLAAAAGTGRFVDATLMENVGLEAIQIVSLDDFCAERGIEKIDVLKLDVQGAEFLALCGATRLLAERQIHAIYAEVLFAPLYEKQACFHDILSLLSEHRYVLWGIYDKSYGKNGALAWADALFISPEIERSLAVR